MCHCVYLGMYYAAICIWLHICMLLCVGVESVKIYVPGCEFLCLLYALVCVCVSMSVLVLECICVFMCLSMHLYVSEVHCYVFALVHKCLGVLTCIFGCGVIWDSLWCSPLSLGHLWVVADPLDAHPVWRSSSLLSVGCVSQSGVPFVARQEAQLCSYILRRYGRWGEGKREEGKIVGHVYFPRETVQPHSQCTSCPILK